MRAVFRVDMGAFIEACYFARNLNLKARRIEARDPSYTALGVPGGRPEGFPANAIGTNRTNSRDHDPTFHFASFLRFCLRPIRQYRLGVMYAANASRSRLSLRHALAGLEAGVLGTLFMLGWIMLASTFNRRSVWLVPNLFASTIYGADAYRNEFLRSSLWGVALFIAIYGGLGILWGCVCRDEARPRLTLYGAIFGIFVYYILFDLVWRRVNGLIFLYAPTQQLIVGHILWGMILARSPKFARRIADFSAQSSIHAEQIKSGEIIR
jgi:hypothetical protein